MEEEHSGTGGPSKTEKQLNQTSHSEYHPKEKLNTDDVAQSKSKPSFGQASHEATQVADLIELEARLKEQIALPPTRNTTYISNLYRARAFDLKRLPRPLRDGSLTRQFPAKTITLLNATAAIDTARFLSSVQYPYLRKSTALQIYQAKELKSMNETLVNMGKMLESKLEAIKLNTAAPLKKKWRLGEKIKRNLRDKALELGQKFIQDQRERHKKSKEERLKHQVVDPQAKKGLFGRASQSSNTALNHLTGKLAQTADSLSKYATKFGNNAKGDLKTHLGEGIGDHLKTISDKLKNNSDKKSLGEHFSVLKKFGESLLVEPTKDKKNFFSIFDESSALDDLKSKDIPTDALKDSKGGLLEAFRLWQDDYQKNTTKHQEYLQKILDKIPQCCCEPEAQTPIEGKSKKPRHRQESKPRTTAHTFAAESHHVTEPILETVSTTTPTKDPWRRRMRMNARAVQDYLRHAQPKIPTPRIDPSHLSETGHSIIQDVKPFEDLKVKAAAKIKSITDHIKSRFSQPTIIQGTPIPGQLRLAASSGTLMLDPQAPHEVKAKFNSIRDRLKAQLETARQKHVSSLGVSQVHDLYTPSSSRHQPIVSPVTPDRVFSQSRELMAQMPHMPGRQEQLFEEKRQRRHKPKTLDAILDEEGTAHIKPSFRQQMSDHIKRASEGLYQHASHTADRLKASTQEHVETLKSTSRQQAEHIRAQAQRTSASVKDKAQRTGASLNVHASTVAEKLKTSSRRHKKAATSIVTGLAVPQTDKSFADKIRKPGLPPTAEEREEHHQDPQMHTAPVDHHEGEKSSEGHKSSWFGWLGDLANGFDTIKDVHDLMRDRAAAKAAGRAAHAEHLAQEAITIEKKLNTTAQSVNHLGAAGRLGNKINARVMSGLSSSRTYTKNTSEAVWNKAKPGVDKAKRAVFRHYYSAEQVALRAEKQAAKEAALNAPRVKKKFLGRVVKGAGRGLGKVIQWGWNDGLKDASRLSRLTAPVIKTGLKVGKIGAGFATRAPGNLMKYGRAMAWGGLIGAGVNAATDHLTTQGSVMNGLGRAAGTAAEWGSMAAILGPEAVPFAAAAGALYGFASHCDAAGRAMSWVSKFTFGKKAVFDHNGDLVSAGQDGLFGGLEHALFGRKAKRDRNGNIVVGGKLGLYGLLDNAVRRFIGKSTFDSNGNEIAAPKAAEQIPGGAKHLNQRLIDPKTLDKTGGVTGGIGSQSIDGVSAPIATLQQSTPADVTHQPEYVKVLNALPKDIQDKISQSKALQTIVWATGVQSASVKDAVDVIKRNYTADEDDKTFIRKILQDRVTSATTGLSAEKANTIRGQIYDQQQLADKISSGESPVSVADVNTAVFGQNSNNAAQLSVMPGEAAISAKDPALKGSAQDRAKTAYEFFVSKGWTPAQASGIVGNLRVENPQFSPTVPGDSGQAIGLAQWHPDRQANISRALGKPISQMTFQEQLEGLNWELNNTEKAAGDQLRQAKTPEEAGKIFALKYERMKDKVNSPAQRASYAMGFYNQFNGSQAQPKGDGPPAVQMASSSGTNTAFAQNSMVKLASATQAQTGTVPSAPLSTELTLNTTPSVMTASDTTRLNTTDQILETATTQAKDQVKSSFASAIKMKAPSAPQIALASTDTHGEKMVDGIGSLNNAMGNVHQSLLTLVDLFDSGKAMSPVTDALKTSKGSTTIVNNTTSHQSITHQTQDIDPRKGGSRTGVYDL